MSRPGIYLANSIPRRTIGETYHKCPRIEDLLNKYCTEIRYSGALKKNVVEIHLLA